MSRDALLSELSSAHRRQARASLRVTRLKRQLRSAELELREARRLVRTVEFAVAGVLYGNQARELELGQVERESLAAVGVTVRSGSTPNSICLQCGRPKSPGDSCASCTAQGGGEL